MRAPLLILLLPATVVGQGVGDHPLCFRVAYDSAQRGATPGMFPPSFVLMPGQERGEVRLPDSVAFLYYRPGLGATNWSYRDGHYNLIIEAGESGVSFSLTVRGDSLVGHVRHYTDAASAPEPTMRAIATRYPCAESK
jgi:hypothetical protein